MSGKVYIQIGAGAGDQDSRANYRDGFSEYIKSTVIESDDQILLVEPNPANIPALKLCWETYPQVSIHQCGIVPKQYSGMDLNFYYAPDDAPHFQVGSFNANHVLKHYPKLNISDLEVLPVKTIDLVSFIHSTIGNSFIQLLSLDIEGIDAEVLLDTDLKSLNVNLISFEHLHLGAKKDQVISHFELSGYKKIGNGIDHNGFDWLYQKNLP